MNKPVRNDEGRYLTVKQMMAQSNLCRSKVLKTVGLKRLAGATPVYGAYRWMSRIAISKRNLGRNIIIIKKRYIIFDIAVRLYI